MSANNTESLAANDLEAVKKLKDGFDNIKRQLSRVIVGQDQVIEELLIALFSRGHCILEGVPGLAKTLMIRTLADALDTIRRSTGGTVKGWLGPALTETENTLDLLAEQGLTYCCDWVCDDQPYPLKVKQGRLISVPYSTEANDLPLFVGNTVSGPQFFDILKDQFDVMYEQAETTGLVLGVGFHPFLVNRPYRQKYLDQFLAYVVSRPGVWLTTGDEIADYYHAHYYDQAMESIRSLQA